MSRRHVSIAAMIGLFVTMGMTGCTTSSPAPTSTPTGFATEAEAFAAAEATYRAYVDALNAVDLSDPATFEPVYALTAGEFNAASRESLSQLHAERVVFEGQRTYFNAEALTWSATDVTLAVCLDVTNLNVVASDGTSMVAAERPDIQSIAVDVDIAGARIKEVRPSEIAGRC
jgi:hypothetical protein